MSTATVIVVILLIVYFSDKLSFSLWHKLASNFLPQMSQSWD